MTTTAPIVQVQHVDFVFLPVKDFDEARRFYRDVLGLRQSKEYGKMPGGEFETGNLTLQILEAEQFGLEFNKSVNPIAFRVDDVHAARERLEAEGVKFLRDTMDSGVCHMAAFEDPSGHVLMLHHRYAPEGEHSPGVE
jgi:catechol 2,3-dioxygenase-like lactoylglutathione lyase family enzyme